MWESIGSLRGERGSAVAESTMIIAVIAVLMVSIMQLAVIIHTRNTMIDAASAGARYAGLADKSVSDGVERAETLLTESIPGASQAQVSAQVSAVPGGDGAELITITVEHGIPMVGFVAAPVTWEVSGHAYSFTQ
ncbi:pilus assembly protein [Auritidibacter ignavus]|uniref:TadE family protein n=1 Tax=Auritidibacter ignavus TaxID=678932 RepID=UPI00244D2E11|nr:pilus assembly protein [Auritidibacter ignavus]WGH90952.1 pilus assembly protein [Auritidibacter ignavus]